MAVCTLQFNPSASLTVNATDTQTADGAIFSIANVEPLNEDYHFYSGGASYTNVNGGFNIPWTIANGRATAGTIPHTQNSDILRQAITLSNQEYSIDWEAFFNSVSQLFTIAFYDSGLNLINAFLVWDSDNRSGLQTGSFVLDATTASNTAYIGYYIQNLSGASVSGNYLNYVRVNNSTGPIKYNLNSDFDYNATGNPTGNFGSLLPGTYTVFARSSNECRATINLTIAATVNYGIKYRFDFDPYTNIVLTALGNKICRVDILQLGYSGAITEIEYGDATPLKLTWENQGGQDPFETVIGSYLTLSIISRTDQQWIEFYTNDERQYKAIAYQVMSAGGVAPVDTVFTPVFHGFITPMLYSEPYNKLDDYPITITFADQLKNLENIPFSDNGGNFPEQRISMMEAVFFCLNKTGLNLNIWESVNLTADGLAAANSDSALEQIFIDCRTYLNDDGTAQSCLDVLNGVLGSTGSRVYQSNGRWNIDLITQKVASSVATRIFIYNAGEYTKSSTTQSPRIPLRKISTPAPKITFIEQSAVFSIAETYGTVHVDYDLQIENETNLLDYGNFEAVDIVNGQLKGYSFTTSGTSIGIGLEKFEVNKNALYVDFDCALTGQSVRLTSNPVTYFYPGDAHFVKVSFDVYTRPLFTDLEIYLDFMVRLVNSDIPITFYLKQDVSNQYRYFGDNTNLFSSKYCRVYIKDHLTWKTITVEGYVSQTSFEGALDVEFDIKSNVTYDYDGVASLRAVDTSGEFIQKYNTRARVRRSVGSPGFLDDQLLFYELEAGDYVDNGFDRIRPTVFNGFSWILKKATPFPTLANGTVAAQSLLQSILIRNVRLEYLPIDRILTESIRATEVINTKVINVRNKSIVHGDITELEQNYRYYTPTYVSRADGEPLTGFKRRGVAESFTLQKLVARILRGQYIQPRVLLSGTVDTREKKPMFDNTIYEYRSGKMFIPLSCDVDFRAGRTTLEMVEVLQGDAVVDSGSPTLPVIEPPVQYGEHSSEFSNEFS